MGEFVQPATKVHPQPPPSSQSQLASRVARAPPLGLLAVCRAASIPAAPHPAALWSLQRGHALSNDGGMAESGS